MEKYEVWDKEAIKYQVKYEVLSRRGYRIPCKIRGLGHRGAIEYHVKYDIFDTGGYRIPCKIRGF